jgi:hypothetical protein
MRRGRAVRVPTALGDGGVGQALLTPVSQGKAGQV